MIKETLEKYRKGTKYPELTIESKSPIPKDKVFDFIFRTDQSTLSRASSNINGLVDMFDDLSGFYDFKKAVYEQAGYDMSVFATNHKDSFNIDCLLSESMCNRMTGNDLPFRFESLFNCSIRSESIINVKTGHLSGELYCGSYPSSEHIYENLLSLSTIEYLDVIVRFWDMPDGLNEREDSDKFENLVSIHISDGKMNVIETDGKKVEKFICNDVFEGLSLRPEMIMPMRDFRSYCSFVKAKVNQLDPADFISIVKNEL